jgi:hypothetical protein
MYYPISSTGCKPDPIAAPSTGCDPAGWRRYWLAESARAGTNWQSLLEAASTTLARLQAMHLSGSSS